jgi:hypothetical protein
MHIWHSFRFRCLAPAALAWMADTRPAETETVVIVTSADCAALTAHVPMPGVDYVPGVDVHGKSVAPADLPGGAGIEPPAFVHIPITIDLAARFGIPATSDLFKAEAYAGSARVSLKDGRAWFNGKPLGSEEQHALSRLCM